MRLLITGGAGYVGSVCAAALVARGHRVTVLDDLSTGNRYAVSARAEFIEGDAGTAAAEVLADGTYDGVLHFASDLRTNMENGDANYLSVLDEADAYAKANGLDLPEEPGARTLLPLPDCVTRPTLALDLQREGISTVIWATGFKLDFGWVDARLTGFKGRALRDDWIAQSKKLATGWRPESKLGDKPAE